MFHTRLLSVLVLLIATSSAANASNNSLKCIKGIEGRFLAQNGSVLTITQPSCRHLAIRETHGNRQWLIKLDGSQIEIPSDLKKSVGGNQFQATYTNDVLSAEMTGNYIFDLGTTKVPFSMRVDFTFHRNGSGQVVEIQAQVKKGQIDINKITGSDAKIITEFKNWASSVLSQPISQLQSKARRIDTPVKSPF